MANPPFISERLARQRRAVFTAFKNPGLLRQTRRSENPCITYEPATFMDLLVQLTTIPPPHGQTYDGVRVYFANYVKGKTSPHGPQIIPPGQYRKFTLVFVPTIKGADDPDHCMIIGADSKVYLFKSTPGGPNDTISLWISEYIFHKYPYFQADGAEEIADREPRYDFTETICIWYDKNLISGEYGMIKYLKDNMNDIDVVNVFIAGYLNAEKDSHDKPIQYQLSLVFNFHFQNDLEINGASEKNPKFLSLASIDFDEKFSNEFKGLGGNADTGNPCPPPNTGCRGTQY